MWGGEAAGTDGSEAQRRGPYLPRPPPPPHPPPPPPSHAPPPPPPHTHTCLQELFTGVGDDDVLLGAAARLRHHPPKLLHPHRAVGVELHAGAVAPRQAGRLRRGEAGGGSGRGPRVGVRVARKREEAECFVEAPPPLPPTLPSPAPLPTTKPTTATSTRSSARTCVSVIPSSLTLGSGWQQSSISSWNLRYGAVQRRTLKCSAE